MVKKTALAGWFASIMGVALTVLPAQAAPIVTSWGFTVNAGFSSYTSTGGGHTGITASATNPTLLLPSVLSWGTGSSGQSSLNLGGTLGSFTGALTTNAAPINTVTVTADNNIINGDTLKFASIFDTLQLTPLVPPGAGFPLPALTFNIDYDETPNSGTCAAPPQSNQCSDILAISNLTNAGFNTSNPSNVFISQLLVYNGEDYQINLFITGLVALDAAECNSVNAADGTSLPSPGCIGFISQENTSNHFQASLQILDQGPVTNIPEPATLALFSAGLGGLASLRRRKMKTA